MINHNATRKGCFLIEMFNEAGHLYAREGTLSLYEIWWIKKGTGSMTIDSEERQVLDDTIYCLPPGRSVKLRALAGLEGCTISLSGDVFFNSCNYASDTQWMNTFVIDTCLVILPHSHDIREELGVIFQYLEREFRRQQHARSEVMTSLLNLLSVYLSRKMNDSGQEFSPSREFILIQKFRTLVSHQFITRKFVSEYADDLRISPTHLNRVVKKMTGKTASSIIHEHILREAKRLALESDSSMKEAAYALGFNDHFHFSRFFRSHCGISYSDFKNGACARQKVRTIVS